MRPFVMVLATCIILSCIPLEYASSRAVTPDPSGRGDEADGTVPDLVSEVQDPPSSQVDYFTESMGAAGEGGGRFFHSTGGLSVALGPGWASYLLRGDRDEASPRSAVVVMRFGRGAPVEPVGEGQLGFVTSFIDDSAPGSRQARNFREVRYDGIYDGVDMIFHARPSGIKYDLVVGPGASPSAIELRFGGADGLFVDPRDGSLGICTGAGTLSENPPVAYQGAGSSRTPVGCAFEVLGPGSVGFVVGDFDNKRPLVIDPELVFSTFMGGSDNEFSGNVVSDDEGFIYTVGDSASPDFPVTAGAYSTVMKGGGDIHVTKARPDGAGLVFSTFIGGRWADVGVSISVDAEHCIYVTGWTLSDDFPTTEDALCSTAAGNLDAIALKLSADGTALLYSTRICGSDGESIFSHKVDPAGNLYAVGYTRSADFPTTSGAFCQTHQGDYDGFLLKLNANGSALVYSTLLGGRKYDLAHDLFVDDRGRVTLVGDSNSTDLPTTPGAYDRTNNGGFDVFVARVSADASGLEFLTLVGADYDDSWTALCPDEAGGFYVAGETGFHGFPTTADAFMKKERGSYDGFVLRMDGQGETITYSTLLGGSELDRIDDLVLLQDGSVCVVGRTSSANFPVSADAYDRSFNGGSDLFVAVLSPDLSSLAYSTYLGGSHVDEACSVCIEPTGDVYVSGYTMGEDFPTTPGALQTVYGGGSEDEILVRFVLVDVPIEARAGADITVDQDEVARFNGSLSSGKGGISNWTWWFQDGGSQVVLYGSSAGHVFRDAGSYVVELTVTDGVGRKATDSLVVTVRDTMPPSADAGLDMSVLQHTRVLFNGSGSADNVGIVAWKWSFEYRGNSVVLDGQGPTAPYVFDDAGTFEVTLEVSDARGNRANGTLVVEVWDTTSPVADAGPDRQVPVLQEVTIDGSGSYDNVGVVSWAWEVEPWNGTILLGTPRINITFNETGTFTVRLTVRDAVGKSGTCMVNLSVVDLERPVAEAGPDQILHDKGKVRLDASASTDNVGIVNYTWSLSYGGVSRQGYGRVTEIFLDEPGSYMISLSVRDRAGNVAEDSLNVTVEIVEPEVPRFHLPSSAWILIVLIVVVVSSALVWAGWRFASSRKSQEP